MISVLLSAVLMSQVSAMCVPCQTCNDILPNGQKVDMVAGVFEYDWEFSCGTVYGTLSPDRRLITIAVPECCKVKVCRKAGTDCDTGSWLLCGQDKVYGVSNGKELSHVSIEAQACCTPPTPTPPTPTATPTPPDPTPTPTKTPVTPTPTKTPCVPNEECGVRCGNASDGCGGTIWCGNCPPPPPPPGRTPIAICDNCEFTDSLSIEAWKKDNVFHAEWFYFMDEKSVRQIVFQTFEAADYEIMVGPQDPNDPKVKTIFKFRGPGVVTIPYPQAGLPIQQWTHLYFSGGQGRMTIWVDDKSKVIIKTDELTAIAMP